MLDMFGIYYKVLLTAAYTWHNIYALMNLCIETVHVVQVRRTSRGFQLDSHSWRSHLRFHLCQHVGPDYDWPRAPLPSKPRVRITDIWTTKSYGSQETMLHERAWPASWRPLAVKHFQSPKDGNSFFPNHCKRSQPSDFIHLWSQPNNQGLRFWCPFCPDMEIIIQDKGKFGMLTKYGGDYL